MRLKLFSDGGARGNPGPAGIGAVIKDENNETVAEISKYLGEQTNNFAEYTALIEGLKKAEGLGATEVECFLDSELVTKQMQGIYKVKEPTLQKLFVQAYNASQKFKKVSFNHVYRENNKEADTLVNRAIDKRS